MSRGRAAPGKRIGVKARSLSREGDMRCVIAAVIAGIIVGLGAPASAALPNRIEFSSLDAVSQWISNYRARPQPARLPAAVHALSRLGAFKDAEGSGVYVGFMAGVIGANPMRANDLVGRMFPIAVADQWAIVRAIAYSGHPDWKGLLQKFAPRMPLRQVMVDKYLEGKLVPLEDVPLEKKKPTLWDKARGLFRNEREGTRASEMTFEQSPELIDTLWGYYFATGSHRPIERIVQLLAWSSERDSVDKLTVASMAKYTLANNAARDTELLAMLKRQSKSEPRAVAVALAEVIDAAETMDTARVRKQALASIEELKRKGPGYKRDITTWGQVGQGALALGCIAAAVTGHVELGLPCVIGGAASSAAMSFWGSQQ